MFLSAEWAIGPEALSAPALAGWGRRRWGASPRGPRQPLEQGPGAAPEEKAADFEKFSFDPTDFLLNGSVAAAESGDADFRPNGRREDAGAGVFL
ncbi:MAG: hypothetical protein QNJ04_16860, partial [Desulfobacterales bacterium]|nr:hypothetical protein [Desulfobacterales bacterium]